jgi:hypothetical protein
MLQFLSVRNRIGEHKMVTLTLTVGMFSETVTCASREGAEERGNEWMDEQRAIVDEEVASGNRRASEIPFDFAVT